MTGQAARPITALQAQAPADMGTALGSGGTASLGFEAEAPGLSDYVSTGARAGTSALHAGAGSGRGGSG